MSNSPLLLPIDLLNFHLQARQLNIHMLFGPIDLIQHRGRYAFGKCAWQKDTTFSPHISATQCHPPLWYIRAGTWHCLVMTKAPD